MNGGRGPEKAEIRTQEEVRVRGDRVFAYQLIPHSRRPRVILIGDEILAEAGGYVLGNFTTSAIAV